MGGLMECENAAVYHQDVALKVPEGDQDDANINENISHLFFLKN